MDREKSTWQYEKGKKSKNEKERENGAWKSFPVTKYTYLLTWIYEGCEKMKSWPGYNAAIIYVITLSFL